MKRLSFLMLALFMILAYLTTAAQAAGTVTVTSAQPRVDGRATRLFITLSWVADVADAPIPNTQIDAASYGLIYVIASNRHDGTKTGITFTYTPSPLIGPVTVHGESRTITSSGNTWVDNFTAYDVHVYIFPPTPPPAPVGGARLDFNVGTHSITSGSGNATISW